MANVKRQKRLEVYFNL